MEKWIRTPGRKVAWKGVGTAGKALVKDDLLLGP